MREQNSLIADRRHSLFGHICRLPENTPASQALQLSIEAHTRTPPAVHWKRPPGRPRRNWLQQLEEDTGLSICWCCLDRGPGSFDVEDATTLSWSSAAVSEFFNVSTGSLKRQFYSPIQTSYLTNLLYLSINIIVRVNLKLQTNSFNFCYKLISLINRVKCTHKSTSFLF